MWQALFSLRVRSKQKGTVSSAVHLGDIFAKCLKKSVCLCLCCVLRVVEFEPHPQTIPVANPVCNPCLTSSCCCCLTLWFLPCLLVFGQLSASFT